MQARSCAGGSRPAPSLRARGFTRWLVAATLLGCGTPPTRPSAPEPASSIRGSVVAPEAVSPARPDARARPHAGTRGVAETFEAAEDAVRASLAVAPVEDVELGKGGRSVSFRVTLADGTIGYFKPEQTFAAHWYAELAAYYIDRALGLRRVPPVIGRRIPWSKLKAHAEQSGHADEVVVQPDGTVRGAFVWWVPERLVPIDPPRGWEAWLSIDPPPAVSPFQRAGRWRRARARAEAEGAPSLPGRVPPPARAELAAELADLVLFDFLIDNADRWGGNFTNVRTRGADGPLVFLDNAGGFHRGREPDARALAQLHTVQRMRKSTIEALRSLRIEELREAMAEDPLAPVLDDVHFRQLRERRQLILRHADEMSDRFGDRATPW